MQSFDGVSGIPGEMVANFVAMAVISSPQIRTDMHGPNGQNVTIWRVTRCFCGYLNFFLENAKIGNFFDRKCTNLVTLVETEFQ